MMIEFFTKPNIIYPTREEGFAGKKPFQIAPFPSMEGFARTIGINRATLYNWADKYPEFRDAKERATDAQKANILEGGMCGVYPTGMAVFAAKNTMGWTDQGNTIEEITGEKRKPLTVEYTVVDPKAPNAS